MNDLVSKDRLMEALGISEDCVDCQHRLNGLCLWKPNMVDVCETISEMPSAEPELKKGIWKNRSLNILYPEWERYECSICGGYSYNYKFCPHCGAEMEKG